MGGPGCRSRAEAQGPGAPLQQRGLVSIGLLSCEQGVGGGPGGPGMGSVYFYFCPSRAVLDSAGLGKASSSGRRAPVAWGWGSQGLFLGSCDVSKKLQRNPAFWMFVWFALCPFQRCHTLV